MKLRRDLQRLSAKSASNPALRRFLLIYLFTRHRFGPSIP